MRFSVSPFAAVPAAIPVTTVVQNTGSSVLPLVIISPQQTIKDALTVLPELWEAGATPQAHLQSNPRLRGSSKKFQGRRESCDCQPMSLITRVPR